MYCPNCGSPNPDNPKFCQNCGTPLSPQGPVAPVQNFNNSPSGYRQNTAPPSGGYIPPNQGYAGQNPGYQQGHVRPAKKKKPALIVAFVLLGIALFVLPILIMAGLDNRNNNNNNVSPSSNIVMAGETSSPPDSGVTGVSADGFRENFTDIKGGGTDVVTVMIYICGADLESESQCGTRDIAEILAADLGDNVNVVLETGGCVDWHTPGINDGMVQRWSVENGQLIELQDRGAMPMLDPTELLDFITFSADNFPANRYQLIFWDHGGGSLYGFGYDEVYPDTVLFLSDIAAVLDTSGVKFDVIGFDACLMGTIETAYMLEPYADYLIASEETEPADGWDYTPWLNSLGANPSIDTVALGQVVVDSFLEQNAPPPGEQSGVDTTLSIVALREAPHVYDMLCEYMSSATEALANKEFKFISTAVSQTRAFAEGGYDLIDIVDFVNNSDLDGQEALTAALESAVKYSNSSARSGVYGLSLYFPYTDLSVYGYAKDIFTQFGFGDEIYVFYDSFVNILADGQNNSTSRTLTENLTGQTEAQTDFSAYDWYDNSDTTNYTYENIDYTELEILWDDVNAYWYLPLTNDDWSLITAVEMQILLDDGTGYIDLGSDQYYETDDAGNLLLNYGQDNTWIAIGGQIVCYYAETIVQTETTDIYVGYVPAVLNETTDIDIILEWDGDETEGYIVGYRLFESNSEIGGAGTLSKGYKQFEIGDRIDFVCDYYTYDGAYDAAYLFGDSLYIGETLPVVTYEDVGTEPTMECYMIVDIYQNYSWTETVTFTSE